MCSCGAVRRFEKLRKLNMEQKLDELNANEKTKLKELRERIYLSKQELEERTKNRMDTENRGTKARINIMAEYGKKKDEGEKQWNRYRDLKWGVEGSDPQELEELYGGLKWEAEGSDPQRLKKELKEELQKLHELFRTRLDETDLDLLIKLEDRNELFELRGKLRKPKNLDSRLQDLASKTSMQDHDSKQLKERLTTTWKLSEDDYVKLEELAERIGKQRMPADTEEFEKIVQRTRPTQQELDKLTQGWNDGHRKKLRMLIDEGTTGFEPTTIKSSCFGPLL